MNEIEKDPRYADARRHARAVRGFYTHALVFVCVNGGLILMNLVASPGRMWSWYGIAGWGLGLLAHGLSVFVFCGWLGRDWEQRKIREYLDRRS